MPEVRRNAMDSCHNGVKIYFESYWHSPARKSRYAREVKIVRLFFATIDSPEQDRQSGHDHTSPRF